MVAITARWGGNPPQLYLCVRLSKSVSQRYKKKSSFIVLFRIKSVFLKSSRGLACWFSVENRLSSSLAWGRLVCSGLQSQLKRTLFGHLHIKNPELLEQRTYVEIEWVKAGRLSPTSVCRKTSLTLIKTGRSMIWSSCPAARNEFCKLLMRSHLYSSHVPFDIRASVVSCSHYIFMTWFISGRGEEGCRVKLGDDAVKPADPPPGSL